MSKLGGIGQKERQGASYTPPPGRLFRLRRAVSKRLALRYANLKPNDVQQLEGVPVTTACTRHRGSHGTREICGDAV